jgi:hypothetical protein
MATAKEQNDKVVKIQSLIRGHLVRKANKVSKDLVDGKP